MQIKIFGDSNFANTPLWFKWRYRCTGIPGLPINDHLLHKALRQSSALTIISPSTEFNGMLHPRFSEVLSLTPSRRFLEYQPTERYFTYRQLHEQTSGHERALLLKHYKEMLRLFFGTHPNVYYLPLCLKWFSRKGFPLSPDSYQQIQEEFIDRLVPLEGLPLNNESLWKDKVGHLSCKGYRQLDLILKSWIAKKFETD